MESGPPTFTKGSDEMELEPSDSDERKELIKLKKQLDNLYIQFCHKFKNLTTTPPSQRREPGFVEPVTNRYRHEILVEVTNILLDLPANSPVFLDSNTNSYAVDRDSRLQAIFGDDKLPFPEEDGNLPSSVKSATVSRMDRWNEHICKFLFVRMDELGSLLVPPPAVPIEMYPPTLESMPPEIWDLILKILKETQEERGLLITSILPLLSKNIKNIHPDLRVPARLKAQIDTKVRRCAYNYLENLSHTFAVSFIVVTTQEYLQFEADEKELEIAELQQDDIKLEELRKTQRSLNRRALIAWSRIDSESNTRSLEIQLNDNSHLELKRVMERFADKTFQMSNSHLDMSRQSLNYWNTKGTWWRYTGSDPDVHYTFVNTVLDLMLPEGYECIIMLTQRDKAYINYRKKSQAIKHVIFEGFYNPMVQHALLCTNIDPEYENPERPYDELHPNLQMHLLYRRSEFMRDVEHEISSVLFNNTRLTHYLAENFTDARYSIVRYKDLTDDKRYRAWTNIKLAVAKFYTFKPDPSIITSDEIKWELWTIPIGYYKLDPKDVKLLKMGITKFMQMVINKQQKDIKELQKH